MRIAVVGATGNIGARLCRRLLAAGHEVRVLSRGGEKLDELVTLGAEPFLGSFDAGTPGLESFFRDADAAFTMVKTDWSNLHSHYAAVAERLVSALQGSPVKRVVNLSSFGGDVTDGSGHFVGFYELEQILNRLSGISVVHLRAGYFMENLLAWVEVVARHGKMPWYFSPDLKLPYVATRDIAEVAARELLAPAGAGHVVREVGSEDLTLAEVAEIIGREIGRPVEALSIPMNRPGLREEVLRRGATPERWGYDVETHGAKNDGRIRFHTTRPPLPTRVADFIHETWRPAYEEAVATMASRPEDFRSWLARLDGR